MAHLPNLPAYLQILYYLDANRYAQCVVGSTWRISKRGGIEGRSDLATIMERDGEFAAISSTGRIAIGSVSGQGNGPRRRNARLISWRRRPSPDADMEAFEIEIAHRPHLKKT